MKMEHPFDLYSWIQKVSEAEWVKEIYIFGSRRYTSNVGFGSDIDLLIVPTKDVSIHALRSMNDERYIDAFLLMANSTAVSTANETAIPVSSTSIREELAARGAIRLWMVVQLECSRGPHSPRRIVRSNSPCRRLLSPGRRHPPESWYHHWILPSLRYRRKRIFRIRIRSCSYRETI
jgi:predicted nucleotidyltransferase